MESFAIAVKCVINNNDNVLLLLKTKEEMKDDKIKNKYDLPGGRVIYKEDLLEAVKREVKEETNLIVNKMELKSADTVIRDDGLHLVILLYKCFVNDIDVKISNEHYGFKWVKANMLKEDYNIPNWIKKSIDKCI